MAEPKIFTKNYVSGDDTIVVSHGDGSKANLYHSDRASKWMTSGANDDDVTASIEVYFYEGSVAATRTIDHIMILGHNLKAWTAYYWDGSAWQTWASETVDAAADTIKSCTSRATTKIKIECTATQVVDAEKYIGELIVCALSLDIGVDWDSHNPKGRERSKEIVLGDGSIHKMTTRFTQYRTQKYESDVVFNYVTEETRDLLKAIREVAEPVLWQPESVTRPAEIYYVHWTTPWDEEYPTSVKSSGNKISMHLKEV